MPHLRWFNRSVWVLVLGVVLQSTGAVAQTAASGSSSYVTWECTGASCPWGYWTGGDALTWPPSAGATSTRHGYTTSSPVYLPASAANGAVISITNGYATLYAGAPSADSHRALATVYAGGAYEVAGLAVGEVLSVQSGAAFDYSLFLPNPQPPTPPSPTSAVVTWTCTGTPCPWGYSDTGNAAVWPASVSPTSVRFGYATSAPVYLPATRANGTSISILSGSATVYVGAPDAASHRAVSTLAAGNTYVVAGVYAGEVLSIQSGASFNYEVVVAAASTPPTKPADPPPPPVPGTLSAAVTWQCTSSPCPWGASVTGHALAWSQSKSPLNQRLGYTTSSAIYLPAVAANAVILTLRSGTASLYAGAPDVASHRYIGTVSANGESYSVHGLLAGEVLSVQSESSFSYDLEFDANPPPPVDAMSSIDAYWRCDTSGCTDPDWQGSVINWPAWAAYSTNARSGSNSRTVYDAAGGLLHPYMGSWANGCEVKVISGDVLIIEWRRGTDDWRETWIGPGETHIISFQGTENGAMIETDGLSPFVVTVKNCTPQAVP